MMATTKKNPNEIAVAVRPYMGSDVVICCVPIRVVMLCIWVVVCVCGW